MSFLLTEVKKNKNKTFVKKKISVLAKQAVRKEAGTALKTGLQDTKPNLKLPSLFQSSQVGNTKLQCLSCNSSRRRDDRPVEEF